MILHAIITILIFVGVLFVLVLAHEWGHFFAARRFGVKVHEFGFGFPPKIFGRVSKKSGTEYTANWIPLGGFVRLKGEDGANREDKDSFAHKPIWARLIILVAGVAMNFVVGYALFVGVYMYGVEQPSMLAGAGAQIQNERPVILEVVKESPAARAGLMPRDELVAVAGMPVAHAQQVYDYLKSHPQSEIIFQVRRGGGEIKNFSATQADLGGGVRGIGVRMTDLSFQKYSVESAAQLAARDTWYTSTMIFKALGSLIKTLFNTGTIEQGVSGPVGIAVITGEVARTGVSPLLQLMAILSINLGVLNLMPFPALDGGRALFVVLQQFFGKRLKNSVEQAAHLIGFALLMVFVLFVTIRDVVHLIQ